MIVQVWITLCECLVFVWRPQSLLQPTKNDMEIQLVSANAPPSLRRSCVFAAQLSRSGISQLDCIGVGVWGPNICSATSGVCLFRVFTKPRPRRFPGLNSDIDHRSKSTRIPSIFHLVLGLNLLYWLRCSFHASSQLDYNRRDPISQSP